MTEHSESSESPLLSARVPLRKDVSPRGEGQVLLAMMAHWTYEDGLYWAQIRYLLTAQLAAFAAWFTVGPSYLAVVIMCAAALVSGLLYNLATVIRLNRDVNLSAMRLLSSHLVEQQVEEAIAAASLEQYSRWGPLGLATHSTTTADDKGQRFQDRVFRNCILLNLAIATLGMYGELSGQSLLTLVHHRL